MLTQRYQRYLQLTSQQVQRSLTVVKVAVETPAEPSEVAKEIVTTAFELRGKVDVLRGELNAIRSTN